MDLSAIALQGLQQADLQLMDAATSLANAASPSPEGSNVDVVDISAEMVALLAAKNQFSVAAATFKVADQVQQTSVNLLA